METSLLPLTGFWRNLWQFSRPHTVVGTSLSVFALFVLALKITTTPLNVVSLGQGLGVWLACIFGNIYIVGLNQLEDIEIDKINKPLLPLASGAFSYGLGQSIVIITGILALVVAAILGPWLFLTVAISLTIGTAYSLPPIRLKRYPFWAALCILTVRGVIVNLGLFSHFTQVFQDRVELSSSVILLTIFIFIFTLGIALFKDVPDTEGDLAYQIKTYTILVGKGTIFKITLGVISSCYLLLIITGMQGTVHLNRWLMVLAHLLLLIFLFFQARQVKLEQQESVSQFYQIIWKLFFLEYLLFPLASWLS